MNETITDVLETLVVLDDLSTKNWLSTYFSVALAFSMIFGIIETIMLYSNKNGKKNSTIAFVLGVIVIAAITIFITIKCSKTTIKLVILTENVNHEQLHQYFKTSGTGADGEAIIEPKAEYYDEALKWYTTVYLAENSSQTQEKR